MKGLHKERFKPQMLNLWRLKTRATVVELEDGLFSFGFDSRRERGDGAEGRSMVI